MNYQSGFIFTRDTASTKGFVDNIINTISALIFPIALSLLFPVMLYGLVLEKEERLVQMMKMNGLKISNYWLVYFIFNFFLCSITNIVFFMLGAFALKTDFFLSTSSTRVFTSTPSLINSCYFFFLATAILSRNNYSFSLTLQKQKKF